MSNDGQTSSLGSNEGDDNKRQGTISSARFNLLSSMVGGGSLSLPLAFHQTGSLLVAPVLLAATSALAEQSILFLVEAGVYSTSSRGRGTGNDNDGEAAGAAAPATVTFSRQIKTNDKKGTASYENMAGQAFGSSARRFSKALVCVCCFAATVGYAVLLRDMLEPIVDSFVKPPDGVGGGPTPARNAAMLIVVFCVSPLTTFENLTALRNVGAASMASVLTVGMCVAYRSIECQVCVRGSQKHGGGDDASAGNLRAFSPSMKELLDAIPLFISSYVCHFNVLPIHNELRCPTSDRVKKWVRTSIWPATLFYYLIGFTGSLFAKCTPSGSIQGNILLDFNEDDSLLLIGRICLAMTITLAFPMLTIPSRDILVRSIMGTRFARHFLQLLPNSHHSLLRSTSRDETADVPSDIAVPEVLTTVEFEPMEISQLGNMEEPLLVLENSSAASTLPNGFARGADELLENTSMPPRLLGSDNGDSRTARAILGLFVFWCGAGLACTVQSIDIVWDLVGSSFSILLAFLIPCGAFLKLSRMAWLNEIQDGGMGYRRWTTSRSVAWVMVLLFAPLMVLSSLNAFYNSFFGSN